MTPPGARGGFDPLAGALALAFFVVALAWIAATAGDMPAPARCAAACGCREACP